MQIKIIIGEAFNDVIQSENAPGKSAKPKNLT